MVVKVSDFPNLFFRLYLLPVFTMTNRKGRREKKDSGEQSLMGSEGEEKLYLQRGYIANSGLDGVSKVVSTGKHNGYDTRESMAKNRKGDRKIVLIWKNFGKYNIKCMFSRTRRCIHLCFLNPDFRGKIQIRLRAEESISPPTDKVPYAKYNS